MRLSAYKKAVDEAKTLPENIPELSSYFEINYNPREKAIIFILTNARQDIKGLYYSEFCKLCQHINDN